MNLDHFFESGWLYNYTVSASKWLDPLVYALGLGIAVCAFRRCRKRGYLVFASYFILMLFLALGMPPISRAIQAHRKPNYSDETMKKTEDAMMKAREQVLKEAGYPPQVVRQRVYFPVASTLLVVGLWLLARREPQQCPETGEPR